MIIIVGFGLLLLRELIKLLRLLLLLILLPEGSYFAFVVILVNVDDVFFGFNFGILNFFDFSYIVPEYSFLDARGLGAYEGKTLEYVSEVRFSLHGLFYLL